MNIKCFNRKTAGSCSVFILLSILLLNSTLVLSARAGAVTFDACRPGSGWVWTTGPLQPGIAQQAELALREAGIMSEVVASSYGEKDSCGTFEPFATDFSVTLTNPSPRSEGLQQAVSETILSSLSQFGKPQLGNVQITFAPGYTKLYRATAKAEPKAVVADSLAAANVMLNKKIYVLVYDPILSNGQNLSSSMGWNSYQTLVQGIIDAFQVPSHGQLQYTVIDTTVITNEWPIKIDGFRYTESAYLAVIHNQVPHHDPDTVNYDAIIGNLGYDICGKLNRGEIDELWMVGGPWFGFYESRLVGPGAYWFNSPPMQQTHGCNKLLPIMGLNYEREVGLHAFGHRAEATMAQVYGGWEQNRTAHNWDRFGLVKAQSPNYDYSGCGSMHYPPNGVTDYDYGNTSTTLTNCEDFLNYPHLSNPQTVVQPVTCNVWGCDAFQYEQYWFGHLPSKEGCGPDSFANNWWKYLADVNLALDPSMACRAFQDVPLNYWAWSFIERLYSAGITGGCGTSPLQYCPETTVTRSQMAVFLERGIHGSSYSPPAVGANTGFGDVPVDYWSAAWIKQLAAEGITGGCGNGNYCPEYPVTRDQMAVFLLRSKHGASYSPPAVGTSTGFGDVPVDHWAAPWIKQLVTEGITAGCGNGNYCPSLPVTRAQMAVFLVRTFNLP